MSSVVFQTIRESKALAYSTNAILSIPNKANKLNYMTAFVGTQSDKFHDAIGSMNSLLNELPVNKEVFELSKQSLVNNIESNRILPENYVNTYWTMKRMNYSEDPSKVMYEKLKTINMQDVVKYHKEFVSNKTYHIGVVASKDRINDEDLKKYGKIEKLTLKQIYGY
jgi:predicted Zn-dependent peptidase